MATSMQFGPEWMRKGPNSKSGNSGPSKESSASPVAATSPGAAPASTSAATTAKVENGPASGTKRNGPIGGLGKLSGPAPVVSPAVSSPGAFSFAAAAAAATATAQGADRNGHPSSVSPANTIAGLTTDNESSASLLANGGGGLGKDKFSREKLLSLYSSDRSVKTPSAEPSPIESAPPNPSMSNAERSSSISRRKAGSDRRPSAFADFNAAGGTMGSLGAGASAATAPLSPGVATGSANEPRGLNARSASGGSSGGFASAATSTWDKSDKERPGLFQRASSGALTGANASSNSRPLSPSVSRDRFTGIQGGVLSGVAPPARKRMDSSDGALTSESARPSRNNTRGSNDENAAPAVSSAAWGRSNDSNHGSGITFSAAFSSNRARSKNPPGPTESVTSPTTAVAPTPSETAAVPTAPIVPSANPDGLSISARFARHKDRLPGEGPIGPPSDGSIGFGKSSGFDRRRERQASQARNTNQSQETDSIKSPNNRAEAAAAPSIGNATGAISERRPTGRSQDPGSNLAGNSSENAAATAEASLGSDDTDLAQHASAVLGSLKLDEDDSPRFPDASALAREMGDHPNDVDDQLQRQQQQPHQPPSSLAPPVTSWSPETSFWLYRDMTGIVQGPFNSLMMQDWYSQQYFADDLLIKRQEDPDFRPLAQIVAAVGNALQPFVTPPQNWLHNPDATKPSFDRQMNDPLLGGSATDDDRFNNAFDTNRPWLGQNTRQQHWPSQLSLSGLGNGGPQPMSPFARPDAFSSPSGGLDSRFRTQEELIHLIREREMQEQRQAAAAAAARGQGMGLGQLGSFAGGLGRSGWGADGGSMSSSNWGMAPQTGPLNQFDSTGFGGGHQSPLVGDRPVLESYNQRPNFDAAASPWANRGSATPRSQYEQQAAAFGGSRPGQSQWNEQQVPWGYNGASAPETPSRHLNEFTEGVLRGESMKTSADPIGTPRRAHSPAPQGDSTFSQHRDEQQQQQHRSFENAFPAPSQPGGSAAEPTPTPALERLEQQPLPSSAAAASFVPAKQGKRTDVKATVASAAGSDAQAPAASEKNATPDAPSSEGFASSEPRPEELWPQSPKAVEFASEPELSGMPELTLHSKSGKDARREQRSALSRQTSDATRGIPGGAEHPNRSSAHSSAMRQHDSGNLRVVSQDQFKRGKDPETSSATTQAPLSSWLQDGSANEASTPTSKPAPWAAKDDVASAASPGPSLREIQEAEAKRAEARRAAEKAAARARMLVSPSDSDDLPTTLSWGLASAPASKASVTGPNHESAAPAAPAWNAGKTAPKKTLMEIQEEERKRAEKLKAQQTAQAIAMRKGYADSASRIASGPIHGSVAANIAGSANSASSAGGAWSVVGASGKPATPAASGPASTAKPSAVASASPSAARPALFSTSSRTASVGSIPNSSNAGANAWSVVGSKGTPSANGPSSPSPVSTPSSARVISQPASLASSVSTTNTKGRPATASTPTDPNSPSPEFLRYCKENLKGLNINVDDFIEMLLSFPLDPSPDVIEIIAESVYANSSTLDGRRFAQDFVAKRKMDVQGRVPNNNGQGAANANAGSGVSRWGSATSGPGSGGMGNFGAGMMGNRSTSSSGASASAGGKSAAELMKAQASSKNSAEMGGFKVVKGKGAKKRT